jgi:hypothetical protein
MRIKIKQEELELLYSRGETMQQIGAKFDVSYTTINRHLKHYGIKTRQPGRRKILNVKERECSRCGETKVISLFVKDKNIACGRGYHCKKCHSGFNGFRSPVEGFTEEDFDTMLKEQSGVCAICNNEETKAHKGGDGVARLCIDHCHTSGAVRGLLCSACNTGIGMFKDSPSTMQSAIEYLKCKVEG